MTIFMIITYIPETAMNSITDAVDMIVVLVVKNDQSYQQTKCLKVRSNRKASTVCSVAAIY